MLRLTVSTPSFNNYDNKQNNDNSDSKHHNDDFVTEQAFAKLGLQHGNGSKHNNDNDDDKRNNFNN